MDVLLHHVPPPPLSGIVTAATGYRTGPFPASIHRGLPSRDLTFVIELIEPLGVRMQAQSVTAHAILGGLHTTPTLIDATGPQEGLQYALSPFGLRILLGVSAAELREGAVDLIDVLGRPGARLLEQLHATADWSERFGLVDRALINRLSTLARPTSPEIVEAWRIIMFTEGRMPVEEVAAHVGWSRRHLAGRFRGVTGVSPKEAARIARFEAVQRRLRTAPPGHALSTSRWSTATRTNPTWHASGGR